MNTEFQVVSLASGDRADRGPAYSVLLDQNRYQALLDKGLSPEEAQLILTQELTVGRASHLIEIALTLGSEVFRRTPYIFDFSYQLGADENGDQRLFREPLEIGDKVVSMMEEGVKNSKGIWRQLSRSVATGIRKLELAVPRSGEGQMFAIVSAAEMEKAYSFIYIYQKIGNKLKGYGIPIWKLRAELSFLAAEHDTHGKKYSPDRLQLLENPIVFDSDQYRQPADIFTLFTGLNESIFNQGLENYHQLQGQIQPEISLDTQLIARRLGPAILARRMASAQKEMIFKTPGYEHIAARIAHLLPGETLSLLVACGLLEFTGIGFNAGVNYVNSLVLGSKEEKVTCPICSQREGKVVKVYCPVGYTCLGCGNIRPC